jgi:hypothetical protein
MPDRVPDPRLAQTLNGPASEAGGPRSVSGADDTTRAALNRATRLEGIDTAELRVNAAMAGVVARLSFTGTADGRVMHAIDDLLRRVHKRCTEAKIVEVTVDFRALDFMDSSCFKAFVTWMNSVRDAPAPQQYKVIFVSNPKLHWQRRSLGALSCFAVELITIRT